MVIVGGPIGTQQIQDGERLPFWKKLLDRHISATVRPILMNLPRWRILAPGSGSNVKILNFWESKMAAVAILKITKNRRQLQFFKPLNYHISATFWPILIKFGTVMHVGPHT